MKKQHHSEKLSMFKFMRLFLNILKPEKSFYTLAVFYGVGISMLSLATPISVQMLINTVANTALAAPLVVLSATLFGLLLVSGLLNALRIHLMEIFSRRFYARMVAEISLRSIYAQNPFFSDRCSGALFNRYFDIVGVQKALPVLLIGGFTVILQAGVGFVLVSLYHPLFLVFNLILVGLIWLVWLIWGAGAIRSAIDLSHAKHNTAAWLETLGTSDGFFKSRKRVEYALNRTNNETQNYIHNHKRHFRRHYAQTLSFLFIYAGASAVLLGLGGWLVIQGQLTLGQLVAAELVLSAAFYGVAQLGTYLNYFYDLCAAVEELSLFYDIEQEDPSGSDPLVSENHNLKFHKIYGKARGQNALLNIEIPTHATVMAAASDHGVQRLFTNLLKRHVLPDSGFLTMGGTDIVELDVHQLRQNIYAIDRTSFISMSVRDYLKLSSDANPSIKITEALDIVGLTDTIADLENGLDTKIATTGWPLSTQEILQLKLANALIAQPRILVLSQIFDMVEPEPLAAAIAKLREVSHTTIIYFSSRRVDLGFDTFLYMDAQKQTFFDEFEDFCLAAHAQTPVRPAAPRFLTPQKINLIGGTQHAL